MKNQIRNSVATTLAACGVLLAGCSSLDVRQAAKDEVEVLKKGPEAAPFRTITGFSDSLRCMDNLMIVYGVRDLPMLVEELVDQTKKMNTGTKDMLISAVSDLSKRSRAVRLVTFGIDASNLANFHANAESKRPYESIPLYDIRGSVSQLDEGVYKKQMNGGLTVGPIGIGAAKSGDSSILSLDLTVISGRDYSVISGVTARNSVMIYKEGAGLDGEAEYKKFGVNFGLTLTRAEGKSQALRSLIELSVVELVGKLTHTPYWTCLGADPMGDAVKTEISDWFYVMAANDELTGWMQTQMYLRGAWQGAIDGQRSPEFDLALIKYRIKLGLTPEARLDEPMFAAYLRKPHLEVLAMPPRPTPPTVVASAAAAAAALAAAEKAERSEKAEKSAGKAIEKPADEKTATDKAAEKSAEKSADKAGAAQPDALILAVTAPKSTFSPGEQVQLAIAPSRDAFVYCYLQDDAGKVQRFYPNRFNRESRVEASKPLTLPGAMRFQLLASEKRVKETIACFATARNVMAELPAAVVGTDFETLSVASLRDVRDAFVKFAGNGVAQGIFHVEPK